MLVAAGPSLGSRGRPLCLRFSDPSRSKNLMLQALWPPSCPAWCDKTVPQKEIVEEASLPRFSCFCKILGPSDEKSNYSTGQEGVTAHAQQWRKERRVTMRMPSCGERQGGGDSAHVQLWRKVRTTPSHW